MDEEGKAEPFESIVIALEAMTAILSKRVGEPYQFRFVSTGQSQPPASALFHWSKAGETGPQPTSTPGEVRSVIYSLADPAARLAVFAKVSSVVTVELAEAAISGFQAGKIVLAYTALRGLIERIAHAHALADAVSSLKSTPADGPLNPVLDMSEIITRALYGTQRDWPAVAKADFRKVSAKELKYARREDVADHGAVNVLNSIDRLEKRIPGTRLVYEILCEFLHPNVGDIWGSTTEAKVSTDRFGTRHLIRTIGFGVKRLSVLEEQQIVYSKMLEICAEIIRYAATPLDDLEQATKVAQSLTRKFAHRAVKNYRDYFGNDDACPCLSGLTVKGCRRRY